VFSFSSVSALAGLPFDCLKQTHHGCSGAEAAFPFSKKRSIHDAQRTSRITISHNPNIT